MIKNSLVALGMVLAAGTAARAEVYGIDLRVEAIERNCAAQKVRIAEAVLAAGESIGKGLSDVRVSCLEDFSGKLPSGQTYRAFGVNVRFSLTSAPTFYTAHWGVASGVPASGPDFGIYSSLGECMDAQADELEAFERQTGLKPAFSACMPERVRDGFVLSITGFGKARAVLHALRLDSAIGGLAGLSQDEVRFVRSRVSVEGGEVRAIRGSRVVYFAPAPVAIRIQSMGHWYEASQCQKQLVDAATTLAGAVFHMECRSENLDIGFYGTDLRVLVSGHAPLNRDFGRTSVLYADFDSCRDSLPEVAQMERELNPTRFMGALCVPESFSLSRFKIEKWNRF